MKVVWSNQAIDDLREILLQVAEYAGLASAEKYHSEFERLLSIAAENPRMGKIGIVAHTRELYPLNGKYRLVYRIAENTIEVATVVMALRKYP